MVRSGSRRARTRPVGADAASGLSALGRLVRQLPGTGGSAGSAGQRQRIADQGGRIGADVLADLEHAGQAGRQRVQDGEPGLGGGQRADRQRMRGQWHGHRPGGRQHVQRLGGDGGAGATTEVRAEFLDDRGHEPREIPVADPGTAARRTGRGSRTLSGRAARGAAPPPGQPGLISTRMFGSP